LFGLTDLGILVVPQSINNNRDLLGQILVVSIVEGFLQGSNSSAVEVIRKIGVAQRAGGTGGSNTDGPSVMTLAKRKTGVCRRY
jgi:hypothetical protein